VSKVTINIKFNILVKNVGRMPCGINGSFTKLWDEMTTTLNLRNWYNRCTALVVFGRCADNMHTKLGICRAQRGEPFYVRERLGVVTEYRREQENCTNATNS
jgi:hypothetical protein